MRKNPILEMRLSLFTVIYSIFMMIILSSAVEAVANDLNSTNYTVANSSGLRWDNIRDPMGGIPFVFGAIGASDYSTVDGALDGHQINARAGLSYYLPDRSWVFDGSFGFQHGKIQAVDSSLLAGVLEGAARYRFYAYWHAGPILNIFVGNGDTFGSSSSLLTSFMGVEIARDLPLESNILRMSFRAMTDLSIPDVRANIVMLNFGWSFPIGRTAPDVIVKLEEARGIHRKTYGTTDSPILVEQDVDTQELSEPLDLEIEEETLAGPNDIYPKTRNPAAKVEDLAVASVNLPRDSKKISVRRRGALEKKPHSNEVSLAQELASNNKPNFANENVVAQGRTENSNEDSYSAVPVVKGNSDEISSSAAAPNRKSESLETLKRSENTSEQSDQNGENSISRKEAKLVSIQVADFGIGRVVPRKGQERKLERLGQALAQNRHLFDRIEVIGHADSNGKKKNLKRVAEYRARGVMEIFAKSGLPRSVMSSKGQGDSSTIGNGKRQRLSAKNRRVEVQFFGAHAPKELNRLVERMIK